MKITSEQVALLESLKCERLSSNPDNMRLVDNFFNRRNSSLETKDLAKRRQAFFDNFNHENEEI